MNKDKLLEEICEKHFRDAVYRFDLKLPRRIMGRGVIYEMYIAPFSSKPWSNDDCRVPLVGVEGAMAEKIENGMVIVSFIVSVGALDCFMEKLWNELKDFDYNVELVNIGRTMGDET